MTFTIREVLDRVVEILEGDGGLAESLEQLRARYGLDQERAWPASVKVLRAAPELVDKAWGSRYPAVSVHCDRVLSRPTEKLRRFSGEVRIGIDVRVSQDRLEGITDRLHYCSDAVRDVIERKSGCLGPGLYLSSETDIRFDGVEKGGSHFLQTGRMICTVIVNRD